MHKLLKTRLLDLQKKLRKERSELKSIFLSERSKADIMKRNKEQIIEEYQREKGMLKKYKMKDTIEMIDYIVELDFALRDLMFILKFK